MTKNWFEYDLNRGSLSVWTWLKIDNDEPWRVNMTKNWKYSLNFWSYSPVNVCPCDDIYFIFNFRSYSPVKVCPCSNIYYIFGHVHKFQSYSLGHLDSVMLITLVYIKSFYTEALQNDNCCVYITIHNLYFYRLPENSSEQSKKGRWILHLFQ